MGAIGARIVPYVQLRDEFTASDRTRRATDHNAVHSNRIANRSIFHHELVFATHGGYELVGCAPVIDRLPGLKIDERNQEVVAWVELKHYV